MRDVAKNDKLQKRHQKGWPISRPVASPTRRRKRPIGAAPLASEDAPALQARFGHVMEGGGPHRGGAAKA